MSTENIEEKLQNILYTDSEIKSADEKEALFYLANFGEATFSFPLLGSVSVSLRKAPVIFRTQGCSLSDEDRFLYSKNVSDNNESITCEQSSSTLDEISGSFGLLPKLSPKKVRGSGTKKAYSEDKYTIIPSGPPRQHKITIEAYQGHSLKGMKFSGKVGTLMSDDDKLEISIQSQLDEEIYIARPETENKTKLFLIKCLLVQHLCIQQVINLKKENDRVKKISSP